MRLAWLGALLFGWQPRVAKSISNEGLPARHSFSSGHEARRDRRDSLARKGEVKFLHGVASGDPLPDAVILWTRVTHQSTDSGGRGGGDAPKAIRVGWVVREAEGGDPDVVKPAAEGTADALAEHDYTVKVDVVGVLKPRIRYTFSFAVGDARSPEGRFTLPPPRGEKLDELSYAVFSCSNWRWGHFQAYGAAAKYPMDFSLHLGDFIYENGPDLYPTDEQAVREDLDPPHELITLEDYRKRYAQHRSDENLQALSAAAPLIAIWDDHEVANNAWKGGAANHNKMDGVYEVRREAALRAYHEWMPTRMDQKATGDALWKNAMRSFEFGNLASLVALETRHTGRSPQSALTRELVSEQILDVIGAAGYPPKDKDHARFFDVMLRAVKAQVEAARREPTREMLGFGQRAWVAEKAKSVAAGDFGWFLVAQPLVMQELLPADHLKAIQQALHRHNPDAPKWMEQVSKATGLVLTANGTIAAHQQHNEMTDAHKNAQVALVSGRRGIALDFDGWGGYAAARDRLLGIIGSAGHGKSIVYGGDSHNAWAGIVRNSAGHPVVVEFDGQSVTSPGMEYYRPWTSPELEASAWRAANAGLAWADLHQRGFMFVHLNETAQHLEYLAVDTSRAGSSTQAKCLVAFAVEKGHVGMRNAKCKDAPPSYHDGHEEPPCEIIECDFDPPEEKLSKPSEDEFEAFEFELDLR